MNQYQLIHAAMSHVLYTTLRTIVPEHDGTGDHGVRDRGAVSIEQVLWYAAAAISVAVVAGIIWGTVKDSADNVSITPPAAP